jgi:metallo-beta-lactamase class B
MVLFLDFVLSMGVSNLYAQSAGEIVRLSDDVEVRKLAEGVWRHTTYFDIAGFENVPANGLIVVDGDDAMMIDLPWTDEQTGMLFDWVVREHKAEIGWVVPTHSHIDCTGGLAEAHRRNAESFALDKTVEILKQTNKPVPKNWFSKRICLSCGETSVEFAFLGSGHAVDNIIAWIPKKKILFGGDLVRARNARNLGNIAEADLESWPETLKKVKEIYSEAKIVVPGHGGHGGPELVEHTIELCGSRR